MVRAMQVVCEKIYYRVLRFKYPVHHNIGIPLSVRENVIRYRQFFY
jgi:hypothetical protein